MKEPSISEPLGAPDFCCPTSMSGVTTSIRQRDEFAITAVSTLVQRLPETLRAQWVSIVVALTSRGPDSAGAATPATFEGLSQQIRDHAETIARLLAEAAALAAEGRVSAASKLLRQVRSLTNDATNLTNAAAFAVGER